VLLTPIEGRVLGCLMEKQVTTPDQYPLSLNALVLACNQATGRDPVMALDAADVDSALVSLRAGGWTRVVHPTHGRGVTKYRHVVDEVLVLEPPGAAVICLLLLRGPQTPGELRTRGERLHPFASPTEVEEVLAELRAREEPLALRLERRPGQKEARWAQLVAATPDAVLDVSPDAGPVTEPATPPVAEPVAAVPREDRLASLEARVAALEARLDALADGESLT
jgi:uncharacterized protein YceH (UPF0502 family)